jgi:hypothetical protein
MKPRFRAIHINRIWSLPEEDLAAIRAFPVGLLLRPSGWMIIGSRPCEVDVTMGMLKGWGLEFGTLAFRKHYPYRKGTSWTVHKNYILREEIQEVLTIGYKPPYSGKGLKMFATAKRPFVSNYPTKWEYDVYWRLSVMLGYPKLEIWGRTNQGRFDPRKWTRIGPHLDGMPITQSLWLQHAERFRVPLATR